MVPLTKMSRVYLCMPPRSHRNTAAAFSGDGSCESVVLYVCCYCMLARLYVCVPVISSGYAAELFGVPHFQIRPLPTALEKYVTSNEGSPKMRQNLLTAL